MPPTFLDLGVPADLAAALAHEGIAEPFPVQSATLPDTLAGRKVDAVLSDLSPNLSGIGNVDQARALELTGAAVAFCRQALKREGFFLVKAFHGAAFAEITSQLKQAFAKVKVVKPSASRGESAETYVVARGLTGL